MLKEERFNHILINLKQKGKVFYEPLAKDLNVSEDTIRRDIEALYNNGLLLKVRGGAISQSKNPLTFQDRSHYFSDEKDIIALKAQQLIRNGQTIFMDGGTTVCAIASRLPANASFRLITNNLALIPIVSKFKDIELIVLGGLYDRKTEIATGGQTADEVSKYVADLYLMGTCAIHKDFGITAVFQNDGEVKQRMLKNSNKTFALSNHAKLNLNEYYKVCDLEDISGLITDLPADDTKLNHFRNSGIQLI
jgi:DeoR family transcriptional regulator, carbon catabolite repression regulator